MRSIRNSKTLIIVITREYVYFGPAAICILIPLILSAMGNKWPNKCQILSIQFSVWFVLAIKIGNMLGSMNQFRLSIFDFNQCEGKKTHLHLLPIRRAKLCYRMADAIYLLNLCKQIIERAAKCIPNTEHTEHLGVRLCAFDLWSFVWFQTALQTAESSAVEPTCEWDSSKPMREYI